MTISSRVSGKGIDCNAVTTWGIFTNTCDGPLARPAIQSRIGKRVVKEWRAAAGGPRLAGADEAAGCDGSLVPQLIFNIRETNFHADHRFPDSPLRSQH